MTIEIISIADCPNHRSTVERVKSLLSSEAVSAEIKEILITSKSDAMALRFIGSPTVRVDGRDVEPRTLVEPALSCRIYEDGSGVPPQDLLKQAIIAAIRREREP